MKPYRCSLPGMLRGQGRWFGRGLYVLERSELAAWRLSLFVLFVVLSCSMVHGSFFNNSFVFLAAAVVRGEAVGDLVSELRISSVHHVVVEVPGF